VQNIIRIANEEGGFLTLDRNDIVHFNSASLEKLRTETPPIVGLVANFVLANEKQQTYMKAILDAIIVRDDGHAGDAVKTAPSDVIRPERKLEQVFTLDAMILRTIAEKQYKIFNDAARTGAILDAVTYGDKQDKLKLDDSIFLASARLYKIYHEPTTSENGIVAIWSSLAREHEEYMSMQYPDKNLELIFQGTSAEGAGIKVTDQQYYNQIVSKRTDNQGIIVKIQDPDYALTTGETLVGICKAHETYDPNSNVDNVYLECKPSSRS